MLFLTWGSYSQSGLALIFKTAGDLGNIRAMESIDRLPNNLRHYQKWNPHEKNTSELWCGSPSNSEYEQIKTVLKIKALCQKKHTSQDHLKNTKLYSLVFNDPYISCTYFVAAPWRLWDALESPVNCRNR